MNAAAIFVILAIIALSALGVHIAEEPLDEVFHLNAAMHGGFPLQPLATKTSAKTQNVNPPAKRIHRKKEQAPEKEVKIAVSQASSIARGEAGGRGAISAQRSMRAVTTR